MKRGWSIHARPRPRRVELKNSIGREESRKLENKNAKGREMKNARGKHGARGGERNFESVRIRGGAETRLLGYVVAIAGC